MQLDEHDIDGLDRLLGQWTVEDALTVLDEIDSRLSIIAAMEKLSGDPEADELHTLHPLVTQARWLFGPEFDSSGMRRTIPCAPSPPACSKSERVDRRLPMQRNALTLSSYPMRHSLLLGRRLSILPGISW